MANPLWGSRTFRVLIGTANRGVVAWRKLLAVHIFTGEMKDTIKCGFEHPGRKQGDGKTGPASVTFQRCPVTAGRGVHGTKKQ